MTFTNFEIVDRKQSKRNQVILTFYFILLIALLNGLNFYFETNFFNISLALIVAIFSYKLLPLKKVSCILLGISSFTIVEGKIHKEIHFNEVAYIDQNVFEGEKPYYVSVTFLNSQFVELYRLNAVGFNYLDLVSLCENIQQTNYEFGTDAYEMNRLSNLWEDEKSFDI